MLVPFFNMITKVLVEQVEKVELLLIAPDWSTQSWCPLINQDTVQSIQFSNGRSLVYLLLDLYEIRGL